MRLSGPEINIFFFVEKSLGYNAPCTLSYEIESILQLESNLVVQSSLSWFVTLALNLTEIWIWVPKVKNKRPLFLMYWAMVWGRSYMTLDSYFYLLSRICDGFKVAKYHSSFLMFFCLLRRHQWNSSGENYQKHKNFEQEQH